MRARAVGSLLAAVVLAVACGSGPPRSETGTPAPSPRPTAGPTTDPPPSPTATSSGIVAPAPPVDVALLADEPAFFPAEGESFTNPGGAAVDADGIVHVLRNSFTVFPGDSAVHHLTSANGLDWQESPAAPVLARDDVPYAGFGGAFVSGLVRDDDGTWVAYLYTYNGEGQPGVIGRATAPDAAGPWTVDEQPVLTPDPARPWMAARVAEPSIARGDDGWHLWFVGFDEDGAGRIGHARSPDGVAWKVDPEPVLEGAGAWDHGTLDGPEVVAWGTGWLMVYGTARRGVGALGVATSAEGTAWTPHPANPAITADLLPRPELYQAAMTVLDGRPLLMLEAGSGRTHTDVYALTLEP